MVICYSCMKEHQNDTCPYCGFNNDNYEVAHHHLIPMTILGEKYMLGRVLGEGGFGITYVGIDVKLGIMLAIKEYYPAGFVTREHSSDVHVFKGEQSDFFYSHKDKFLGEAKRLARLRNLPGIVSVGDFFEQNNTAYIVMEYIKGQTYKEYINKMGGSIQSEQVFDMMKPVMQSLAKVHEVGIIHRDISPDNIMISNDGFVKLIDFGAARDYAQAGKNSMSVMLKQGYSPEEQYRSKGVQGPWTDVYSLCATMYKCMTAITPEESTQRVREDTLIPPSHMGITINPQKESVLLRGLAVYAEDRISSIDELINELCTDYGIPQETSNTTLQTEQPIKKQHKETRERVVLFCIIISAITLLIVLGIMVFRGEQNYATLPEAPIATPATAPEEIPIPIG